MESGEADATPAPGSRNWTVMCRATPVSSGLGGAGHRTGLQGGWPGSSEGQVGLRPHSNSGSLVGRAQGLYNNSSEQRGPPRDTHTHTHTHTPSNVLAPHPDTNTAQEPSRRGLGGGRTGTGRAVCRAWSLAPPGQAAGASPRPGWWRGHRALTERTPSACRWPPGRPHSRAAAG